MTLCPVLATDIALPCYEQNNRADLTIHKGRRPSSPWSVYGSQLQGWEFESDSRYGYLMCQLGQVTLPPPCSKPVARWIYKCGVVSLLSMVLAL